MPVFQAQSLIDFSCALFEAAGAPPDIARDVAVSLVNTNLAGHESHGVIQIIKYMGKIRDGHLLPAERPVLAQQAEATAAIDCRWGFGQIGARFGAGVTRDLAYQYGIGCVALQQVNHIGRLGEYAEWLAAEGLISLVLTSGSMFRGTVAPYGGRERLFGTNPIAWAVPAGADQPPLVGDFATAALAAGKMAVATSKGEPIPPGVLLEADGNPTTDPTAFDRGGVLLPFGSYKGYSLTLMVEIIASLLAGFAPASSVAFKQGNPTIILALEVERFTPREHFEGLVQELIGNIKAVKPADGFDEVLLPGEIEARARQCQAQEGIVLPEALWHQLVDLAAEWGVTAP